MRSRTPWAIGFRGLTVLWAATVAASFAALIPVLFGHQPPVPVQDVR